MSPNRRKTSQLPALFRLLSDNLRRKMLTEVALQPRTLDQLAADMDVDASLLVDAGIALSDFGVVWADSSSGEIVYRPTEAASAERTAHHLILRVKLSSGEEFELDLREP